MQSQLPLLIAAAMVVVLMLLAQRDHRRLRASRRDLLGPCAHLLAEPQILHGGDDFPRLEGRHDGAPVRVELIPDTMTIRRLPQLWLSVATCTPLPGISGFAALVRPNGNEFYALAHRYPVRLEAPEGLPREILINGESPEAQHLLDAIAPAAAAILADPRVKELAVTPKGIRIVRQAGEGRRGEHLLLRQAVFDDAHVGAPDLEAILAAAAALRDAAPRKPHRVAA